MSLLVMMTNSCSKSNSSSSGGICPFSKETFQGKIYKATYKKLDSNGIDITNRFNASDTFCASNNRWRLGLDATVCTYYQIPLSPSSSCTTQAYKGVWSIHEQNSMKYIACTFFPASSHATQGVWNDTFYFERFDCNSFEYDFNYIDSFTGSSPITYKGTFIYSKI